MNVSVSESSGFCWGVERAFNMVNKLVEEGKAPVQTYGELVHNPDVARFLEKRGVSVANSIDEVVNGAHVVVRAHGIPESEMAKLKEKAGFVYDGKCPTVGALQKWVNKKVEAEYFTLVFGKPGHPEMVYVTADLPDGSYAVVENFGEAVKQLQKNHHPHIYLCAQTTKDPVALSRMAEELRASFNGAGITFEEKDTTCKPTGSAKRFAEALARESDCMVVIGGANSSNTRELVSVCESVYAGIGKKVIPVENGRGLKKYLKGGLFNGVENVGISAGTSTPPWVIANVRKRLSDYNPM